jgi:beta-glucosidase
VGQLPLYYNHKNTGRPHPDDVPYRKFTSCYIDELNGPLYPFGYGLSYTRFSLGGLTLSAGEIEPGEPVTAAFTVTNTGDRAGVAVPQLYLRDMVSSVVKPKIRLAAFARVSLEPGETKRVTLDIRPREMRTLGRDFVWRIEPGEFRVSLAHDCEHIVMTRSFRVK